MPPVYLVLDQVMSGKGILSSRGILATKNYTDLKST